jgi:hypothetical protein
MPCGQKLIWAAKTPGEKKEKDYQNEKSHYTDNCAFYDLLFMFFFFCGIGRI